MMNWFLCKKVRLMGAAFGLLFTLLFLGTVATNVYGQGGSTISGIVFGLDRRPMTELQIELLDEFQRTIQRTRTNSAGRYLFSRLASGRYIVRVLTYGTSYEEKDEEVEITNFSRATPNGTSTGGYSNEQRDVTLRLRKGVDTGVAAAAVFTQEIPAEAKTLYEKAVTDLEAKKTEAGLAALRASLEVFPKYFYALQKLGTEYVRLGHYEAAEILLMIAVDVNPRSYQSWYGLAYAQYSQKKYAAASVSVEKSIVLDPLASEPLALSGVLMRQNKKFEEAEKRLLKARDLSKDTNPQIHWELALLYSNNMKRYKDAARELRLFLKGQPESKDAQMIKKLITDLEAKTDGQ